MQITPIQNHQQNFQGLHAGKRTLKRLGVTREKLLQNKSIKDCADRAEVFIKSKTYLSSNRFDGDKLEGAAGLGLFAGVCVGVPGAIIGGLLYAFDVAESLELAMGIPVGIGASLPILAGGAYLLSLIFPLEYTARMQASDGVKNGKPTGRKTKVYERESEALSDKYKNFKLSEELLNIGNQDFRKIMYKYRDRDFSDTKTFLDILNEDKVKTDFKNGDIFNYKLNEQGDTLLTRFFDIVPYITSGQAP